MVGLPAGEREAKAPTNMSPVCKDRVMGLQVLGQDEYKEWLRAAGRRTLDKYRHQKGLAAKGAASGAGAAPGAPAPPPAVELTTFKVFTQPAEVATGRATLPTEMPRLGQGMASTSLGALPPSSACAPPLHKTSCSSSAASGTVVAGSLPSSTGYSLAGSSFAGTSPAPEGFLMGRQEDEGPTGLDINSGVRAGSGADQAMVDMLLAQVEALMRDKAALSAENAGLRQQVEQLTELVGWLSLERGEEGADPSEEPGQDLGLTAERAMEGAVEGGEAGPGLSAESAVTVTGDAGEGTEPGIVRSPVTATGPRATAGQEADAEEAGSLGPLG